MILEEAGLLQIVRHVVIHGFFIKSGLEFEPDLLIALAAMYAKSGEVQVAKSLFDQVPFPNVILWNTMISEYGKNGCTNEAVDLLRKMISVKARPDSVTLRSAILAFAQVGVLELAIWMDDYVRWSEFQGDVLVNTALIVMFAKCGSIRHAKMVFDRIPCKDVSHVLVDEGRKYFHSMRTDYYGIEPRHQHYACVVDLLGCAGYLDEAYNFVSSALLTACKIHGNVRLGEYAAERVFALDPMNAGHYLQLSNIYASAGMWKDVSKVGVLMKERGLVKALGYSLIEINGRLQAFRVGDKSHSKSKEILAMLEKLVGKL
ncbi:hypothetical protein ACLOJK_007237 [Asimina triloba]